MYEFFHEFFISPILNSTGYNIVNTLTYAIILIFAVFGVYKALEKLKIRIDGKFGLGLLPWILLGSVLRVLEDSGYFISYFLISPLIYITIFIIAFSFLLICLALERLTKIKYQSYFFSLGFILVGTFFTQVNIINFSGIAQVLVLDLIWLLLILKLGELKKFTQPLFNKLTIFSQVYDANSTFISLQFYSFREQHLLPNLLISLVGGNWVFFIFIKLAIVVLLIYFIEKYLESENFKNWVKLVIIVLGVAQGTRDMLSLGVFG